MRLIHSVTYLVIAFSVASSCKKGSIQQPSVSPAAIERPPSTTVEADLPVHGELKDEYIHRIFTMGEETELKLTGLGSFFDQVQKAIDDFSAIMKRPDVLPRDSPRMPVTTPIGTFAKNTPSELQLSVPRQEPVTSLDQIALKNHEAGGVFVVSKAHPSLPDPIRRSLGEGPSTFSHGGLNYKKTAETGEAATFQIENPEYLLRRDLARLTPDELAKKGWKLRETKKIAKGGHGVVYKETFDGPEGRTVELAVKKITVRVGESKKVTAVDIETGNNKVFGNHPRFVGFFGRRDGTGNVALYSELLIPIKGTSVRARTPDEMLKMTSEASEGLAFMHGSGYLHRDVKPDNFLLDSSDGLRISDLGTTTKVENLSSGVKTEYGSTSFFLPKEYYAQFKAGKDPMYSKDTEMYALGLSLFELRRGRPLLGDLFSKGTNEFSMMYQINEGKIYTGIRKDILTARPKPDDLDDLYWRMIHEDPLQRPRSMTEVNEAVQAIRGGRYEAFKTEKGWGAIDWKS